MLDLDAYIPLGGTQEVRFFHGYDREYCYIPLLFLIGRHPVLVRLWSAGSRAGRIRLRLLKLGASARAPSGRPSPGSAVNTAPYTTQPSSRRRFLAAD